MLDSLPATDKSFSRLLGEVPSLTDSVMKLLHDLCCEKYLGKDTTGGDRVTQGLGAVWSLILGRPLNRQACLDIALNVRLLWEFLVLAQSCVSSALIYLYSSTKNLLFIVC